MSKIYTNNLERLQKMREDSTGIERKEIQDKIDEHFLSNPPSQKRKRKRKRKIMNEDDLWW